MNVTGFFWELTKATLFNPRMWEDMAIILGPVLAAFAAFIWYKIRHQEAEQASESKNLHI